MKSLFFYILFLIPVFAISQNDYLPFPTDEAEWTTLNITSAHDLNQLFSNDHYRSGGDTLIDNYSFTKLFKSIGKFYNEDNKIYVGAYRSVNNQILFVAKDSVEVQMLYDFDIEPGWILSRMNFWADICNLTDSIPGCFYFQLETIDTITLSDQIPRRRYNFFFKESSGQEGTYHHSWIEGIGSTLGFFPDPANFYSQLYPVDISYSNYLLCHQQDGQLLYTDSTYYKGRCYRDVTEELYPYQPMAVEGAHWIVASQRSGGLWLDWKASLTIRGDTVVNGKQYKKLYEEAFYFDDVRKVHSNQIVGSNLTALLRDDTLQRKVYCIQTNPTNETLPCPGDEAFLLFDFSVEVGDTLDWCGLSRQNHYPKVDSIRFEAVYWTPGIQRKTLYTKLLWSIYGDLGTTPVAIIEGIGYDIIGPFLIGSYLIDYCVGTDAQCGIITATKNIQLQEAFNIYPNPSNAYITIEKADHTFENSSIIYLTDQFGRLISQRYYNNISQKRIDITNLPSGIYFLEIVDQDHVMKYRQKVIKAETR